MYQIYTFPNCDKCDCVKGLLEERRISYEEISAVGDGKAKLREFIQKNKEKLNYESKGNMRFLVLPVVIYANEQNTRMHQGRDGLEAFLEKNENI